MKLLLIIIFAFFYACSKEEVETNSDKKIKLQQTKDQKTKQKKRAFGKGDLNFELVREFEHFIHSYTQGLIFVDSIIYETSGGYGKSLLMEVNPNNGNFIRDKRLPLTIFAEGIELIDNRIYMLTWKSGSCLVYDRDFNLLDQFNYEGEGWGITANNNYIFISDGSHKIQIREKATFNLVRKIEVFDESGLPISDINELEFAEGEIFANIWMQDKIIRIDPQTGEYLGKINLSQLRDRLELNPEAESMNGIAYDESNQEFYVTGKNWKKFFVLKFY